MESKQNQESLQNQIKDLETRLLELKRHEQINQVLFKISNAVNISSDLVELYKSIHQSLSSIIDTKNFFIALYDKKDDSCAFPYCIDEIDGQLPSVVNISKTASLTAAVIRSGRPILFTKKDTLAYREKSGLVIPGCTPSEIWLGAPLKIEDRIIGVMALQSYTDGNLYDETDKDVITAVADQVALAIDRKRSEENREALIKELHSALDEVKTLQGILPICSHCKKIRDDKGYWNQLESYIQAHSKALFSHGLCPACADTLYGNEDWYLEYKEERGK